MPWVKTDKPPKNALSATAKADILSEATRFLDEHYKPERTPTGRDKHNNYVSGHNVKWRGPYLVFTATYSCPGPNAIVPSFDHSFARLGCFARDRFNIWARRHNDEWLVLDDGLTLKQCFARMGEDSWFRA